MTTDTSRRLLRAALKRFEEAVRDQAQLATADPEDWEAIEWEYTDAMRSLYSRLGLTAPRLRKDRSGKLVRAVTLPPLHPFDEQ